jgi:hypothetical protein
MKRLPRGRNLGDLMNRRALISGDRGLIEPGNIDLFRRPSVWNPEAGGYSSVYSTSFNVGGLEVLVPRVSDDGRLLSEDEALKEYFRTGRHLGIFVDAESANRAGERIHLQQERMER